MRDIKYVMTGVLAPPPEQNTEAVKFYDEAGIDWISYPDQANFTVPRTIWTPDIVPSAEHFDVDSWLDTWELMTAASMVTKRAKIGLLVTDTLRRPPSVLAQQALTLNHFAKGRFILGLGAGEMKQVTPYGIPNDKPFGRLEESIKIIRMLWETNDPISYDGPIWKLKNAVLGLQPYEGVPPPIVVAGGTPRAFDIIGKYGDGWFVYLPPCGDPQWFAEQVATIKRNALQAGRDPEKFYFLAGFAAVVRNTEAEVEEACNNLAIRWDTAALVPGPDAWKRIGLSNPLGDKWAYAHDLIPMEWSREDALRIARQVPPEAVRKLKLCGTPPQAAAQIQPYIEAGANVILLFNYGEMVASGKIGDSEGGGNPVLDTYQILRSMNGQQPLVIPKR